MIDRVFVLVLAAAIGLSEGGSYGGVERPAAELRGNARTVLADDPCPGCMLGTHRSGGATSFSFTLNFGGGSYNGLCFNWGTQEEPDCEAALGCKTGAMSYTVQNATGTARQYNVWVGSGAPPTKTLVTIQPGAAGEVTFEVGDASDPQDLPCGGWVYLAQDKINLSDVAGASCSDCPES